MGYPGHPEIELALVKLWRATGEKRYFDLARFFIENRDASSSPPNTIRRWTGMTALTGKTTCPICDHKNIKGHAVRATYLLSGATDVAGETESSPLLEDDQPSLA